MSDTPNIKTKEVDYSITITDEDIEQIGHDAEQYVDDYKRSGTFSNLPVFFLKEGTYVYRIWPDRDATGQIRVIRKVIGHKLPNGKRIKFVKEIDDMINDAVKAGVEKDEVSQHYSRMLGIMMVRLISGPTDKYIHPGMDAACIMSRKQMASIQQTIKDLKPHHRVELLTPTNKALPFTTNIQGKGAKQNVATSISHYGPGSEPIALTSMILPENAEWKGLDDVWIPETAVLTDEDRFEFRKWLNEKIHNAQQGDSRPQSPVTNGEGAGHGFSSPQPSVNGSATTENPGQENAKLQIEAGNPAYTKCLIANKTLKKPQLGEQFPGVHFGNPPGVINADCVICDFQVECNKLADETKAATA